MVKDVELDKEVAPELKGARIFARPLARLVSCDFVMEQTQGGHRLRPVELPMTFCM